MDSEQQDARLTDKKTTEQLLRLPSQELSPQSATFSSSYTGALISALSAAYGSAIFSTGSLPVFDMEQVQVGRKYVGNCLQAKQHCNISVLCTMNIQILAFQPPSHAWPTCTVTEASVPSAHLASTADACACRDTATGDCCTPQLQTEELMRMRPNCVPLKASDRPASECQGCIALAPAICAAYSLRAQSQSSRRAQLQQGPAGSPGGQC